MENNFFRWVLEKGSVSDWHIRNLSPTSTQQNFLYSRFTKSNRDDPDAEVRESKGKYGKTMMPSWDQENIVKTEIRFTFSKKLEKLEIFLKSSNSG